MSTNLEYWGPIAITIASVFCIAFTLHVFNDVGNQYRNTIAKVAPQVETNEYVEYYKRNNGFTIINASKTHLKARRRHFNAKHVKVSK